MITIVKLKEGIYIDVEDLANHITGAIYKKNISRRFPSNHHFEASEIIFTKDHERKLTLAFEKPNKHGAFTRVASELDPQQLKELLANLPQRFSNVLLKIFDEVNVEFSPRHRQEELIENFGWNRSVKDPQSFYSQRSNSIPIKVASSNFPRSIPTSDEESLGVSLTNSSAQFYISSDESDDDKGQIETNNNNDIYNLMSPDSQYTFSMSPRNSLVVPKPISDHEQENQGGHYIHRVGKLNPLIFPATTFELSSSSESENSPERT